uniref:Uncharacterized protein n=1 Tax=Arundo donax TaxID=35708 RepID=A0A0A9A9Q7_ARUDO
MVYMVTSYRKLLVSHSATFFLRSYHKPFTRLHMLELNCTTYFHL